MFYGKLVAGSLGLLLGGVFGLVLGLFVGHVFDRGLQRTLQFASPENIARIKNSFFETTFMLLGHMAKADGHVSREEIGHTEQIFIQMQLNAEQKTRAKDAFRRGTEADFNVEQTVQSFLQVCGSQRQLLQTMLLFLISLALVDQEIENQERAALHRIAGLFGYSAPQLEQLLKMAQAQGHFHGGGGSSQTSLQDAYTALGVSGSIGDKELKRAYRKLMSEHHPDKLIAKGVPEHMVRVATEKAQDIQVAYDMVKKSRGLK
ncbi:MAG: DnaJ like chaperone protein [Halieaceae bacterium]|jgi:DnaJ like chaperone protein